jgi:hypothetical protein
VAAFVKATLHESVEAADITFRIGRHALADLALQFRLEPASVDRLSEADFAELFAIVDRSTAENVDVRRRSGGSLDCARSTSQTHRRSPSISRSSCRPGSTANRRGREPRRARPRMEPAATSWARERARHKPANETEVRVRYT